MQKISKFQITGMQRDLSPSVFNPKYSYENRNLRITPTSSNTLLELVNEKGTKELAISGLQDIKGIPIGKATIDDKLVLFTAINRNVDTIIPEFESTIPNIDASPLSITIPDSNYIYKFWYDNNELKGKLLYSGELGFNTKYPIETLVFYENENIQKVYWVDTINQPRVINIEAAESTIQKWNNNSFNFSIPLVLNEDVVISREDAGGSFPSGVVQYSFTYFNKYGQESNIFYTSPLYYTSFSERGGSGEDKTTNSFNINIYNADTNFEYVRIYSITRTSIDSDVHIKKVIDLKIPELPEYKGYRYNYLLSGTNIINSITVSNDLDGSVKDMWDAFNLEQNQGTTPASIIGQQTWADGNTTILIPNYAEITIPPESRTYVRIFIFGNNKYGINIESYDEELSIKQLRTPTISYTDTNLSGEDVDATHLLYIGGEECVIGTLAQKDNKLFLGDIQLKTNIVSQDIKDSFKGKNIVFERGKTIDTPRQSGYYTYTNYLKYNSEQIKTFKYCETYRFGVQVQYKNGKWSDPIFIGDYRNTISVYNNYTSQEPIQLVTAKCTITDKVLLSNLNAKGYTRIRPIIVYPKLSERESVCQGILCPTVYNVGSRKGNAPFAQSSWFARPNAPYDYKDSIMEYEENGIHYYGDWVDINNGKNLSFWNSRASLFANGRIKAAENASGNATYHNEYLGTGAWAEFRHNAPIPPNHKPNSEIQCLYDPYDVIYYPYNNLNDNDYCNEYFFIDQNIVTLHSPDLEFDDNFANYDLSKCKLRIIGVVPLTAFYSDVDIQTSTGPQESNGFFKYGVNSSMNGRLGWHCMLATPLWSDKFWNGDSTEPPLAGNLLGQSRQETYNRIEDRDGNAVYWFNFIVYPFHRSGSLNNCRYADSSGYRPAMLQYKKWSNSRFSYGTWYIPPQRMQDSDGNNWVCDIKLFNSNEVTALQLDAPQPLQDNGISKYVYYGNVDTSINVTRQKDKVDRSAGYIIHEMPSDYKVLIYDHEEHLQTYHVNGYEPINDSRYIWVAPKSGALIDYDKCSGVDPVRMRYKSSPHAVIALNYAMYNNPIQNIQGYYQVVLPTLNLDNKAINTRGLSLLSDKTFFWDKMWKIRGGVFQSSINVNIPYNINNTIEDRRDSSVSYGFFWLGELYNDSIVNRFGGTTEEALKQNKWLPCGEPVSLKDPNTGALYDTITIQWTEGDTYYQRYDHIKTYPFSLNEYNGVSEIVSFMCESRINLDGRYDTNRGRLTHFVTSPENFNKVNKIYSQDNNYFQYDYLDKDFSKLTDFPNSITWTTTKVSNETVDSWTNLTFASILDLDGDKGKVRAIKNYNNTLVAFQDSGISTILYNDNMQISSTDGVPIEIGNSEFVRGKRYISSSLGCINKWSITETPNGIYFLDNKSRSLYLYNGEFKSISDSLGFKSYFNEKLNNIDIWNPINTGTIITQYDPINKDVLFIDDKDCVAYSELVGQFTSFYSYEGLSMLANINNKNIIARNFNDDSTKLWLMHGGKYNEFFDVYKPFSVTLLANPDGDLDKIYDNLEFVSTGYNDGSVVQDTYDTIETWNEYQSGKISLINTIDKPSTLKRKFRIWRAQIPRDRTNKRDRMRNPWLYIKLSKENANTNRITLSNIGIKYFDSLPSSKKEE